MKLGVTPRTCHTFFLMSGQVFFIDFHTVDVCTFAKTAALFDCIHIHVQDISIVFTVSIIGLSSDFTFH